MIVKYCNMYKPIGDILYYLKSKLSTIKVVPQWN